MAVDALAAALGSLAPAYREEVGRWWPVNGSQDELWGSDWRFEVVVGAVLTQNTTWTAASKALSKIRARRWLTPGRLLDSTRESLEAACRPAGGYRRKAQTLRAVAAQIIDVGGQGPWLVQPTPHPRRQLLAVHGIGPETADAILSFAASRPVFVVDAYARRLLLRITGKPAPKAYEAVQQLFVDALRLAGIPPTDGHAIVVEHAKARCRARKPACLGCPAADHCDTCVSATAPGV